MKKIVFLMVLSFVFFLAVGTDDSQSQVAQPATNETPVLYDPFDRENPVVKLPGMALTYVRGHDRGEAIFFDGKTYLRESALTFVPAGKNWVEGTVEFWIKPAKYPPAPQNSQIVLFNWFDWPKPQSGYVGNISLTPEGKIMADCGWEWGGGNPPVITSQSSVLLNTWTHVAVAWSKAEGYTRIYINNKPDVEIETYCARGSNGYIYPWLAGYGGFVGALDEFKIYKISVAPPFYANADMEKNDATDAKVSEARQKGEKGAFEFKSYIMDNNYFSCDIPSSWDLEREKDRDEEYKIYEIELIAPQAGKAPTAIYVSYYAKDNADFDGYEDFIERNSSNVLGETKNERETYEPVKKIKLSGRKAFELSRARTTYLNPESKSDENVQLQEKMYILPAGDGFYVLHFTAPKAVFLKYLSVFEHISRSFNSRPPAAHAPTKELSVEKKSESVSDFAQYVVPQGWTAADETNQGDPQSALTRDMHTIKTRLSGGPGSRYKLPEDFLVGFEARSHGGKPGEKLDWVVVSGLRVLIYRRAISVSLPPPDASGPISMTQEEFCVVPAGKRFFILNYFYGDSIPDPTYDGQKAWRQFLKDFRLKKTFSSK